ncbi:MAG: hypothetical protein EHM28_11685, partial [Spirochaetaceae bacterium]
TTQSLALRGSTLYVAGSNGNQQIYSGDIKEIPNFVPHLRNVSRMASGSNHSLVIKTDGTLWVAGNNSSGQLGTGDGRNTIAFEKKIALRSFKNGQYVCADLEYGPDAPLYSNRSIIGPWETFGLLDLGWPDCKYVALRSYATGNYVTATNEGTSRAQASSLGCGDWEVFRLDNNGSGVYAFCVIDDFMNKYLRYDSFIPEQSSLGQGVFFYICNLDNK